MEGSSGNETLPGAGDSEGTGRGRIKPTTSRDPRSRDHVSFWAEGGPGGQVLFSREPQASSPLLGWPAASWCRAWGHPLVAEPLQTLSPAPGVVWARLAGPGFSAVCTSPVPAEGLLRCDHVHRRGPCTVTGMTSRGTLGTVRRCRDRMLGCECLAKWGPRLPIPSLPFPPPAPQQPPAGRRPLPLPGQGPDPHLTDTCPRRALCWVTTSPRSRGGGYVRL